MGICAVSNGGITMLLTGDNNMHWYTESSSTLVLSSDHPPLVEFPANNRCLTCAAALPLAHVATPRTAYTDIG
jgi:hypothetical protein